MPKRAQFAPGFAELRGNISGRQNLEYPTNDNKAFDGPIDGKNYARNYRASVIVSQRARDGKFYYSIRTKSMNHLTTKSKKAMALLGGAGAIYAAILRTPAVLAGIQAQYAAVQELGEKRSFRKYVMDTVRLGLIRHDLNFTFAGPAQAVTVNNPWVKMTGDLNISISNAIRIKFWTELVANGIKFTIDGTTGVAQSNDVFNDVIDGNFNVLGITRTEDAFAQYGGMFIKLGADYIDTGAEVTSGGKYVTTDIDPE